VLACVHMYVSVYDCVSVCMCLCAYACVQCKCVCVYMHGCKSMYISIRTGPPFAEVDTYIYIYIYI